MFSSIVLRMMCYKDNLNCVSLDPYKCQKQMFANIFVNIVAETIENYDILLLHNSIYFATILNLSQKLYGR